MTYVQITILFLLGWLPSSAQNFSFKAVEPSSLLIESGEYKNYYKYDLGDFIFYKGRYENNLKFKIQNKSTNEIEYAYEDSTSDAMILKPKFFTNEDKSAMVLMFEVAAEYSWGQEIVLIKNNLIKYLGYIDYAVAFDNEESIANYCMLKGYNDKIILSFADVPIVDWANDRNIINGKDLKFELSIEGIKKIK